MRTRAIILKKQAAGEYDQLVTCYTEEFGKILAVAKSAMKSNSIQGMHLDFFNLVDFDLVNGRAVPIITGAQAEETYPGIKNNLASLVGGYFFMELVDKIAFEYQRDDEIWNFLVTLLEELNVGSKNIKSFINDKQVEFLGILGYAPNLNECGFCERRDKNALIAYSMEVRGAVCRDCFLNGRRGVVIKDGDWLSEAVLGSIFESVVEKRLYSLNLINTVLKLKI